MHSVDIGQPIGEPSAMGTRRFAFDLACAAALLAVGAGCAEPAETTGAGTQAPAAVRPSPTMEPDRGAAAPSPAPVSPTAAPPPPRTFVDEDGLRCLEYETSAVNRSVSGVCFDDGHDELGIRTVDAGTHHPKPTVIGGTDVVDAVRVVIVGDGAEHHVDLVVVDGWPERIFVADLPGGAVEVRLEAEDGRVVSSATV